MLIVATLSQLTLYSNIIMLTGKRISLVFPYIYQGSLRKIQNPRYCYWKANRKVSLVVV